MKTPVKIKKKKEKVQISKKDPENKKVKVLQDKNDQESKIQSFLETFIQLTNENQE